MKIIYTENVIEIMRTYLSKLPERLRREYAAVESRKFGHGGINYVSEILQMDRKTIRRGRKEVDGLLECAAANRQRKPGGGRKKKLQKAANFAKN